MGGTSFPRRDSRHPGFIRCETAALARAYGTHSLSRARRLLGYFEERGLIVVRNDFKGLRIVAFPDLDAETAPGDPNRAEEQAQAAE